jgi:hypothetical protein
MKNKLSTILGVLCIAAILTACCITDKNGDPCAVNYVLFAVATLFGIGSKLTEKRYGRLR